MINPFTLQGKIEQLQSDVLGPLYTMHNEQGIANHDFLLSQTGQVIEANRPFIEELSGSRIVATAFTIIKLFGGADQLSNDDFNRFTSYVREGGLKAMVKMLLSVKKEEVFVTELHSLPNHIQKNASLMLEKSATLHDGYIRKYLINSYDTIEASPAKLQENWKKSTAFILRLAELAKRRRR